MKIFRSTPKQLILSAIQVAAVLAIFFVGSQSFAYPVNCDDTVASDGGHTRQYVVRVDHPRWASFEIKSDNRQYSDFAFFTRSGTGEKEYTGWSNQGKQYAVEYSPAANSVRVLENVREIGWMYITSRIQCKGLRRPSFSLE